MNRVRLQRCPRCSGDLYLEESVGRTPEETPGPVQEPEWHCLQCGYTLGAWAKRRDPEPVGVAAGRAR